MEQAVKYEKHLILLQLLQWENKLGRNKTRTNKIEKNTYVLFDEIFDTIEKYKI